MAASIIIGQPYDAFPNIFGPQRDCPRQLKTVTIAGNQQANQANAPTATTPLRGSCLGLISPSGIASVVGSSRLHRNRPRWRTWIIPPLLSTTVNDTTYVPAFGNTIAPGLGTELDSGIPSGKNHEYFCTEPSGSLAVPAKLTAWPALMVASPVRRCNRPFGGLM
jgi:hypothetical protein